MIAATRKRWLLLLLVLMISHAALTIHSGAHLVLEQQSCHLCTQNANLSHAVPPSLSLPIEFGQEATRAWSGVATGTALALLTYRGRAPPQTP